MGDGQSKDGNTSNQLESDRTSGNDSENGYKNEELSLKHCCGTCSEMKRLRAQELLLRERVSRAVRSCDLKEINKLVKDGFAWKAMCLAIDEGNKDVVTFLIKKGANAKVRRKTSDYYFEHEDKNGCEDFKAKKSENNEMHPGAVAVCTSYEAIAPLLLIERDDNKTALHYAASRGRTEMVVFLIERGGVDVNCKDDHGQTALHEAALGGQAEVAALLIEKGAEINAKSNGGSTPLHYSSRSLCPRKELTGMLIEKGVDVNAKDERGNTALHLAAGYGYEELTALLIEKGADLNAKNQDGKTVLHAAASRGQKHVAALLIAKGADVNVKDNKRRTPLHYSANCVFRIYPNSELTAMILIEKGADVNANDEGGKTALHLVAQNGYKQLAAILIEKGAVLNAKTEDGKTPLHIAVCNRYEGVAALLIEKGADVEAKDNFGWTALHWVASRQCYGALHDEMVSCSFARVLIENGADVNAKDADKTTPLHLAVRCRNRSLAVLLIQNGANVNVKDIEGNSAKSLMANRFGFKNLLEQAPM